jgi:hypothetical protein
MNKLVLTSMPIEDLRAMIEDAVNCSIRSNPKSQSKEDFDEYLPIKDICGKGKYMSKPTFYSHVKKGTVKLYKLGSKSFVKKDEFFSMFHKIEL